jgi:hypothetical protein
MLPDHEREYQMGAARMIREDFLTDEDLVREVRCRVEQERVNFEALGGVYNSDDYVRATLGHLADVVQESIRADAQGRAVVQCDRRIGSSCERGKHMQGTFGILVHV